MADLTEKQRVFCEEYLIDLNATQAAIRAGYSKKTANEQGSQNLAKLSIQEYLQKRFKSRSERTGITADYVLNTIKETVEEAREDCDRRNVLRGSELLGRHLKLFTDKVDVNANVVTETQEQWVKRMNGQSGE